MLQCGGRLLERSAAGQELSSALGGIAEGRWW